LPIDAEVARQFVHILPPCERTGGVPILDALVAATAVVEQIPVVTRDRVYDAIPGVEVICV
jgi:predicted nucleic acid-binding protein